MSAIPPAPVCKVSRIYFNYYLADVKLLGIRPECGVNVMPEDLSRYPTLPYNAVAYAMDATRGKQLKLHAEFSGPPNSALLVRTADPVKQHGGSLRDYLEAAGIVIAEEDKSMPQARLLGDVAPTSVTFDADGNSFVFVEGTPANPKDRDYGVVELTIDNADIWRRGICASWQLWQWQYSADNGASWHSAGGLLENGISIHRIFTTKSVPTWPWTSYDEEVKNIDGEYLVSHPPLVGALEWACRWANGETTEHGIASLITAGINDSGRFRYTSMQNYTSPFSNHFDCGRFVDRLNGRFGRGPNANCVDCTYMVISLANALGCQLQPGRISNPDGLCFELNPLTLIGDDEVARDSLNDLLSPRFKFHQVVLRPVAAPDGDRYSVFDACLKFDVAIFLKYAYEKTTSEPKTTKLPPILQHGHPVDIPLGKSVFTFGYLAVLVKRFDQPSQTDLDVDHSDDLTYAIGSLKFY
ncbi:MAG: hypothetical protein R3330_03215 [Saprospiraceae bacterium]|nr:hypothetical protein [Saprospiraceae bacterium]